MNDAVAEPQGWVSRRWWEVVVLIFLGQLAFILWLSERKGNPPLPEPAVPQTFLPAEQTASLPGLGDPTLFALPNVHGFSGPAWLQAPVVDYKRSPWTEQPRWLELPTNRLGGSFTDFVRTNVGAPFEVIKPLEPQADASVADADAEVMPAQSTLRVEGKLAGRGLISEPKLDSWAMADVVLKASEVLVAVDVQGRVFSAVLLGRSGLKEADEAALNLARTAQFTPLPISNIKSEISNSLTWGRLIFQWHTAPPPDVTAAAGAP